MNLALLSFFTVFHLSTSEVNLFVLNFFTSTVDDLMHAITSGSVEVEKLMAFNYFS
jgi:hypothetical protein